LSAIVIIVPVAAIGYLPSPWWQICAGALGLLLVAAVVLVVQALRGK
jgi:uncharacterized membrane protein YdcZ (DUF606 family)